MSIDFSIIIPTFRRPEELRCAIESVRRQEGVEVEILVVDDSADHSASATVASFDDPRVIYMPNPKPSGGFPSQVRNYAWPAAKGRFVHFLDDDDTVPAGHYAAVMETFARAPQIGVVFSKISPFGKCPPEQLEREKRYFAEASRLAAICARIGSKLSFVSCMMFHWALFVCGAAIIRRDCLVEIGGFDPSIKVREDVDFFSRAMRHCGVYFLDQVGLNYRIGYPSLMHNPVLAASVIDDLRVAQLKTNARYKKERGILEFFLLKIFARSVLRLA